MKNSFKKIEPLEIEKFELKLIKIKDKSSKTENK